MEELIRNFENAAQALRDAGFNVVAVISHYQENDADFHTFLHVHETPEADVTEDHTLLDALREIANEWSEGNHETNNRLKGN